MIIFILIISLLFEIDESQQIVIPQADKCQCYQIRNIDDCIADQQCTWIFQQNGTQQSCQSTSDNITSSYSLSCSNQSDSSCISYFSKCAMINSFCTFFSGCTSYNYTTVSQCQSVSLLCTSDGIGCINVEYSCTLYQNYYACQGSEDTYFGQSCKWANSTCRNQDCSDAPTTYTTNSNCSRWQSNCISIGRGCNTKLLNCELYKYSNGCDGLIGLDGNCATDYTKQVCRKANCSDAPTNYTTDQQCNSYLTGCKTYGRGCVQILQLCSSYPKSQDCNGLRGSDGFCIDDPNTKNCKALKCTDAPNSINTNQGCSEFLKGCFTTGYGCSDKLLPCSQFNKSSGCSNFNGTDGPCIDGTTACRAMTCEEAPPTFAQTDSCSGFKPGCLSNGVRCADKLILCSQYNQTFIQLGCENIIGIDGNCVEDTSNNKTTCRAKSCSDAPQNYQNDTICNKYLFGCVTNGKGCTKTRLPCTSYNNTKGCADYISDQGRCGDGVNSTQCTTIQCKDAPATISTDSGCQSFWKTCYTNGKGCVTTKTPCNQFNMTIGCEGYIGTDGACFSSNDTSGKCRSAICEDAQLPTYNISSCSQFKYGCMSSGIGCVTTRMPCSKYNQSQGCSNIIGSDGGCWNDLNSTLANCKPRICSDASSELYKDSDCSNFLYGCQTNGRGCVTQRQLCNTYKADSDCETYIGSDGRCFLDNTTVSVCRRRQCTDFNATTDDQCSNFLPGCRTDGEKCLSSVQCSQFKYASLCSTDTSGYRCLWNRKFKSCFRFSSCQDYPGQTTEICQTISPQCISNGKNCISKNKCKYYLNQISCVNGVDGFCGWISKNSTCQLFEVSLTLNGTTFEECQLWNSRYITNGIKCVAKSSCGNYDTATSCAYGSYDNKTCQWDGNLKKCSDILCSDFQLTSYQECVKKQSTKPCTFDGTRCIEQTNCNLYDNSYSCVQGSDGICIWTSISQTDNNTNYGCRLRQCSDLNLKTSLECSKTSSQCVSNGQKCIDITNCKNYNNYESCQGGGIDGVCVYTKGACKLFESCQEASYDEQACKFKSDSCYFSTDQQNVTSCNIHTCDTKARGSTCQSVPNFGLTIFQICINNGTQCIPTQPIDLNKTNCYEKSLSTYTWNGQSCQICQDQIVDNIYGILLIFNIMLISL